MAPKPFALDRFKTQLKLSINRLVLLQKKLTAQSLGARKEIAELLKVNKTDQALTKVHPSLHPHPLNALVRSDTLSETISWLRPWKLSKASVMICSSRLI